MEVEVPFRHRQKGTDGCGDHRQGQLLSAWSLVVWGRKKQYSAKPEFLGIVQKHKAFHVEAGKIARLINNQQYDLAEKEMGTGTPYSQASSAVGAAIVAFNL
ncbi:hypothetical protein WJ972_23275 [Achromobacter insuavis]